MAAKHHGEVVEGVEDVAGEELLDAVVGVAHSADVCETLEGQESGAGVGDAKLLASFRVRCPMSR